MKLPSSPTKLIRRIGLVKADDKLGGVGIRRIFGGIVRTATGEHTASKRVGRLPR